MEKKKYIKPAMEIVELEMLSMVATSGIGVDNESEGGYEQLSHGRRGKWGDLWADDESK